MTTTRRAPINIVICSDGTGNSAIKGRGSNVFKLYEAVDTTGRFVEMGDEETRAARSLQRAADRTNAGEADLLSYVYFDSAYTGLLERLGWEITPPKAGMFVWAKIPEPWSE